MAQTKVQLLQPDLGDVIDFDTSTLFVDGADNRIGIRNTNPQYELDVTGTINATNFRGNIQVGTIDDWIVHAGDSNTKFGFSANDTFQVQTGGSGRVTVTDSATTVDNDLRIVKTSGPLLELTTNANTADATLRLSEGATGTTNNGGGMFYSGADNKLYITCGTNSTTKRITIQRDDGKVGVGIDAPTAKFEVQNGSNIEVLRLKDTHFNKYLTIRGGGSPNRMVIDSYEGGGGGADIDFASNGSTKLRITSSGQLIMTNAATQTFFDFSTTNNNTRGLFSIAGKDSSGNAVTVRIGGFGDTGRGEIFTHSNHELGFATNNAAAQWKMKTGGNFEITNGDVVVASGHGIDFSATNNSLGSMSNELLDDYEEGSWTPVPGKYSGGAISGTYSQQEGNYTKVGRLVTVEFHIHMTAISSQGTNINYLDGLPYVPVAAYRASGSVTRNTLFTMDHVSTCNVHGDFGGCIYFAQATRGTAIANTNWTPGYLNGSISYITAS